jgi:hypothetical protein
MIPYKVSIQFFRLFSVTIYLKKKLNSSNQTLYGGDINVFTRVQPNIAKQIYNIVYFSYYFLSYLNIYH